jgi:hypothetical protein
MEMHALKSLKGGTDFVVKNVRTDASHVGAEEIVSLYGHVIQIFQDLSKT